MVIKNQGLENFRKEHDRLSEEIHQLNSEVLALQSEMDELESEHSELIERVKNWFGCTCLLSHETHRSYCPRKEPEEKGE